MNGDIAVIGGGHWGKNLIRNFAQLGRLRWIIDQNAQTLERHLSTYPGVQVTQNLVNSLNDPEVKGLVIATPAATHFSLAKQALEANKDVFIEKPLSLSVKDGQDLVNLAKQESRVLLVGHVLEYHPAVIKLKEMTQNGELGDLQYIFSNRLSLGKIRQEENVLWSFAPHDISTVTSLFKSFPSRVAAHGSTFLQKDIVDFCTINLEFPSGQRAHIFVSWLQPVKEQKLVVIGRGKMAVFDDCVGEDKLKVYHNKVDWKDGIPTPIKGGVDVLPIASHEPLRAECQHFLDCIKNRQLPLSDGEQGLQVLKILDAAQRSMDQMGTPVNI